MLNNAAEYQQWRQRMLTTERTQAKTAATVMVSRAIIELLATDQFYGELLTRLPRTVVTGLTAPFALAWRENQLVLQVDADVLATTFARFDQLQAGLKHVALHVLWQHPLRYRTTVQRQPELVHLATDVAVNQYVSGLPQPTVTLATVQAQVATRLPRKADSGTYLRLLQAAPQPVSRPQGGQPSESKGRQPAPSSGPKPVSIDDSNSWSATTGQLTNPNLAESRLQQLAKDAWTATPEAGRGLVAGRAVAALTRERRPASVDWRRLLMRGLGRIPAGRRPSRARFNRRQPARMELPGQVTDRRLNIVVYVDHSGSISDAQLARFLSEVAALTQLVQAQITVQAFDAVVQPGATYQASLPQQIQFSRHGGGGTVFQSVFDDLAARHLTNQNALAIILTDGRGEREVAAHHFTNVLWLLARPTDQLSVRPVVGRVVHLGGEQHGGSLETD
ncbi:vWA domain-containing protein [Lactiplantibacillus modestisalitolerans]|uniref:VWA-like domain-containing protein n=1 Tax=Lactiplantibacillus modestisalitolerans TaxID=1457219 RepID=A0ABV5WT56_9LACO|nr:VWA-like domain-containing protein [Lactiplantibacillus modestisalitolerans]